jgi:hypothetical protein
LIAGFSGLFFLCYKIMAIALSIAIYIFSKVA